MMVIYGLLVGLVLYCLMVLCILMLVMVNIFVVIVFIGFGMVCWWICLLMLGGVIVGGWLGVKVGNKLFLCVI